MISTLGVKKNEHYKSLIQNEKMRDVLFVKKEDQK